MPVPLTDFLLTLGLALVVVLAVVAVVHVGAVIASRRWSIAGHLARTVSAPFRVLALVLVVSSVVRGARPELVPETVWSGVELALRLAAIGAVAWFVGVLLLFAEDLGLRRYRTDVADNRQARRLKTQVLVIRRLTIVLVVIIGVGAALLSFPGVRAVGASLLASAGLVSVVAAVAAQSTLANVFAGIQLAFSDAIRIDDVLVVEEQFGRVEEITLSYVVVRLWDDRRLVLPSTYFTKEPFENWTRHSSELVGSVEIDLDWATDVDGLRAHLDEVLVQTPLWDGRTQNLQVTDATGGLVRVRVLVSAVDAGTLFDLRCHVREQLVAWSRTHAADALPRRRVELVGSSVEREPTGRQQAEPPYAFAQPS